VREVGLIGYGNMGRVLAEGWLATATLAAANLAVSTRTPATLASLAHQWPDVAIGTDNVAAARDVRVVVLGVGPADVLPVLAAVAPHLSGDAHVVSIAASVTLDALAGVYDGPVSRVMPSLAAEVRAGVSLVCHGARVTPEAAARAESLFAALGGITHVDEADFDVAIALTGCAPGLLASIADHLVRAALRHGALSEADARRMAVAALLGTARLSAEPGTGFDDLVTRVATYGGVTAAGVDVLDRRLPAVFDELFEAMLARQRAARARPVRPD
jgi:pyrroline-5-carboxylate reductase